MLRWLYIQLIWLHPAPFRWRFGDQMLDIFDGAAGRARLRYLADAVASLGRQWLLRPEFRRPEAAPAVEASGALLFQTIEDYKLHPAALLQGGLLAILWITIAVVLIAKGGGIARPFLIGVRSSKPSLLPIDRNSLETGSDLDTTVKLGPDLFEPWLKLARPYFASLAVLRTLDADRDLALSPREIANAPESLRSLDAGHDGKLTAEGCGLHIDSTSMSAAALAQLRRRFMSFHPVLAALDADHDSEISAWEIEHAAAALKNLDRNHDGYLTADELLPLELAVRAGLR